MNQGGGKSAIYEGGRGIPTFHPINAACEMTVLGLDEQEQNTRVPSSEDYSLHRIATVHIQHIHVHKIGQTKY